MNHLETVLTARLNDLADEMTPIVDPRRQVADARARNHRQRRGRVALFAVATATAAVVVGSAVAVDLLSADAEGDVANPGISTPATTESATPSTSAPIPGVEAAMIPPGWEARSFQGVTFAVPPGARMADYVQESAGPDTGPMLIWNGPHLGDDRAYAHVKIIVGERGAEAPEYDGYESVAVSGAEQAYATVGTSTHGNPVDPSDTFDVTAGGAEIFTADRHIHVDFEFTLGPAGEQMARDLIGSIDVAPENASAFTVQDGVHFAYVLSARPPYSDDGLVGALTIQPADWLGSGPDDDSCLAGQEFPLNVSDYCVGPAQVARALGVAIDEITLSPGNGPIHTVDFAEFSDVVERESLIPQGPIMGWLTIRDGVLVDFQQVPEQVA